MTEHELAPRESAFRIFWVRVVELLRSNPIPLLVVGLIAFSFLAPYILPTEGRREAFPKAIQKQVDRECTCPRVAPKAKPKRKATPAPVQAPKKEPRIVIVPPGDPRVNRWPPNWGVPMQHLGGAK